MKTRFLALLALLACTQGCDALLSDPGGDFQVTAPPARIELRQHVGKVAVDVTVGGCDDFDVSIEAGGTTSRALERSAIQPLGDDRYRLSIDPEALYRDDGYCNYDEEHPQVGGASLVVKCRLDDRSTRANVSYRYATAAKAIYRGRGPSDGVFPGAAAGRFFDLGSGWLQKVDETGVRDETSAASGASLEPLLVEDGKNEKVHLFTECTIGDCGIFYWEDTATSKAGTMGTFLQTFDGGLGGRSRNVLVPGGANALVADPDGDVHLLSRLSDASLHTTVRDGKASATHFQDEEAVAFGVRDGRRVFLTRFGQDRVRLRAIDDSILNDIALPGSGAVDYVSLAPTADAVVAFRGGDAWLVTLATGTYAQLETSLTEIGGQNTAEDTSFSATWTESGVAIRDRRTIEVFSRKAPHAMVWSATPNEGNAVIVAATAVGDSVAVLRSTGLQIFDATGERTGGADPLPPACTVPYSRRHLAVVGPDTVALSGKTTVYQFKVASP